MFDARLRPLIDPPLNAMGRWLARAGVSANQVTLAGLTVGLGGAVAVAGRHFWLGLALIVLSRLLDGLDGAVARARGKSDFGGYLDIVCDFAFYVAVPVGFGFADPANLPSALVLVACFTVTGISFLAFAVLAAQHGLETTAHGEKSFFYNTGLAEGGETIAFFLAMCLWPGGFQLLAAAFAVLCVLTVVQRSLAARHVLKGTP
ncbi:MULTISPECIES: CDP-alcohol phosphatidyltransferase family protein [Sphingomonas]|uniref:CDP-alcohol phosphatidyltransferase family protein n=1 Tax=Sphingomonas TaxID=13687 RepID=UPI000835DAF7|nr:CDP-alcohol phosphatidyltransferase family protein [Sphingomonas sp. CCH10-B3]MBA3879306.1 CDP-alcohol phosphatidyltransferase family protein [Sphingobium sp.]